MMHTPWKREFLTLEKTARNFCLIRNFCLRILKILAFFYPLVFCGSVLVVCVILARTVYVCSFNNDCVWVQFIIKSSNYECLQFALESFDTGYGISLVHFHLFNEYLYLFLNACVCYLFTFECALVLTFVRLASIGPSASFARVVSVSLSFIVLLRVFLPFR